MKLLSSSNLKLKKNLLPTFGLSLMPEKRNSQKINLCTFSTKECRKVCIVDSGYARYKAVNEGRLKKTDYYLTEKSKFITELWAELNYVNILEKKALIRLNMYSDINWYNEFLVLGYNLESLTNLIFYGYTKNPTILENDAKLANFDTIFSFSGYNWLLCKYYLENNICNVSMVFKLKKGEKIPKTYKGFEVINGDETDQRLKIIEGTGKIIALKYKNPIGKKGSTFESSKFIIEL